MPSDLIGMTIVTTLYQSQPIGVTVSLFTSVSLEPPLVLVCLDKHLFTHRVVAESGIFAVNILNGDQVELGQRFAGMIPGVTDRFDGLQTTTAVTGSPLLPDCLAWIDCRVWRQYDGGDHSIFVGEVVAVASCEAQTPLLYHNRQWLRGETISVNGAH